MKNSPPPAAAGRWHMYGTFVPSKSTVTGGMSSSQGVMFTTNCGNECLMPIIPTPDANIRTGFAVFVNAITTFTTKFQGTIQAEEGYLRTAAHELGHALNLIHRDGDARDFNSNASGTTIMNQVWRSTSDWNYLWDDRSFTHFNHHPLERIRPSVLGSPTAFDWLKCHNIYGDVQH